MLRLCVLVFLLLPPLAWSSAPAQDSTITYQGKLQQTGTPFTGTADLEFRLFDQPSGGSQVGPTVTRGNWPVEDGIFQVELDFGAAVFGSQARYLQVRVNGNALSPRQAVRPVPVALFALAGNEGPEGPQGEAGPPGPEGPQGDSFWEEVPDGIQYDQGRIRVGIGTFDDSRVRVDAGSQMDAIHATSSTQGGNAILGRSTALSGVGVRGEATVGPTFGVGGFHSSTSGTGVFGRASSSSGETFGVHGIANSPAGTGVLGQAMANSGLNFGIRGETNSTNGIGVLGRGNSSSGVNIGVKGETNSTDGYGMWGDATAITGTNFGVIGTNSSSTAGAGLLGRAFSAIGPVIGVQGVTGSADGWAGYFTGPPGSSNYFQRRLGIGVLDPLAQLHVRADSVQPNPLRLVRSNGIEAMRVNAAGDVGIGTSNPGVRLDVTAPSGNVIRATHSNAHFGVLGDTNSGVFGQRGGAGFTARAWLGHANGIGVFAQAGNDALAGRFEGNVVVTGSLSKGGGSFQIDHPLDPENKYLFHSFVESPDMMNIYNGNVVTDGFGYAEVELPAYFEALNTDFRYQLTVIGTFAQAIVAEEISDNRFVIATDQPEVKVSWQVTGIRDDAWARANRIEVEVPKPEHARGQYLHPEAFARDDAGQEH